MREKIEGFKALLQNENKLSGHEDVLLAFDHLLQMVDEHEAQHQVEFGVRGLNHEKGNGEVEAAIREEISFIRHAAYTVIERTVFDLINKGKKDWERFYPKVE